jgi:hypothetical protein
MPNFYEMIEIIERDRPLDEDWKKWALPAAVAAGSLASAYRAVNYPTKPNDSRPAATSRAEADDAPRKGDARWERFARVLGVGRANEDLARRQSNHRLGIGGMGGEVNRGESEKDKGFGIGGMGGEIEQGEDDGFGIGGMGGDYPRKSATSDDAKDFF